MSYSLDQIDWCDVPLVPPIIDPQWEKQSAKRIGKPTYLSRFVSPVPWMLEVDELLHSRVTPGVPVHLAGLIGLVVAMDNSCRHCYGAFRSLLKIMGYREEEIQKMEESLVLDQLQDKEKVALEFARNVSRSAPRPGEADLRVVAEAGYSPVEIAEIAFLAASSIYGNRLATLLALPPDPIEALESSWVSRLARPLIRRGVHKSISRVSVPESPVGYNGMGSELIKKFGDSPAGPTLAVALSRAWESEITSRRIKALIFAVIARGMGCDYCEGQATDTLREEGWTESEIDHLLTHLASDRLDAVELKVLRFARETIRYQTRRIQDLSRDFAEGVDRAFLLEVMGLVSYANSLSRLSILLYQC